MTTQALRSAAAPTAARTDTHPRWQSPATRPELASPPRPRPTVSLLRHAPRRASSVGLSWVGLCR